MMKKIILPLLAAAALTAAADDGKVIIPDSTGFKFTDIKLVPTNSVKDQNRSGTCWCFAGTSFIEDEILRKSGRSIDLSEMWTVRHCYNDKADRYIRLQGAANFAAGGSLIDVPYVIETYGIVPEEAYPGLKYGEDKHDHTELDAALRAYVRSINTTHGKRLSTAWKAGLNGILDAYLGTMPQTFQYQGKTYTPQTFAQSLGLDMDDYVAITSYTHHPFYKAFPIEVADNWLHAPYINLPLDEMVAIVDKAIDNGYSIEWAADVSEGGFKWRKGYALLPKAKSTTDMEGTELSRWVQLSDKDREDSRYDIKGPVEEETVTQEMRQEMFDRQETTDDHGMVIIGHAVDQDGNPYYKVKNSWDTNQLYNGYFYVSVPYFKAKTLSILVNKEAIPKAIAKKLK